MNPDKHQFRAVGDVNAWSKELAPTIAKYESILPGYRCHAGSTAASAEKFLATYPGRQTALLYSSPGLTAVEIGSCASSKMVAFHVVLQGKMTAASRALLPKAKAVDIRDDFNKLDRNADYGGPELFTDRYKTFGATAVGFGDYGSMGSSFQATGGTPHAIAIHAAYRHPENSDVWIEHFVSDDTDIAVGDVSSKFLQAARKLVKAVNKRPDEFGNNFALDAYRTQVAGHHFPGLAASKKQQIEHHICLMLDALEVA